MFTVYKANSRRHALVESSNTVAESTWVAQTTWACLVDSVQPAGGQISLRSEFNSPGQTPPCALLGVWSLGSPTQAASPLGTFLSRL